VVAVLLLSLRMRERRRGWEVVEEGYEMRWDEVLSGMGRGNYMIPAFGMHLRIHIYVRQRDEQTGR
jgi:hypothetical protein